MSKNFDLETFTFNGHALRTVVIDGKPWFAIPDIGRALGANLDNIAAHVANSCGDAEVTILLRKETPPELQGVFKKRGSALGLVSESGFYKYILRAQRSNPAAREFQDWITKTVIPSIRKTGRRPHHPRKVCT